MENTAYVFISVHGDFECEDENCETYKSFNLQDTGIQKLYWNMVAPFGVINFVDDARSHFEMFNGENCAYDPKIKRSLFNKFDDFKKRPKSDFSRTYDKRYTEYVFSDNDRVVNKKFSIEKSEYEKTKSDNKNPDWKVIIKTNEGQSNNITETIIKYLFDTGIRFQSNEYLHP